MPSPVTSTKRRLGSFQSSTGNERKSTKSAPIGLGRTSVKTRRFGRKVDEIQLTTARHIHQVMLPAVKHRQGRLQLHRFSRAKPALAEIWLVEPCPVLMRQNAGNALAVEVKPAVTVTVDTAGEIVEIGRVDIFGDGWNSRSSSGLSV